MSGWNTSDPTATSKALRQAAAELYGDTFANSQSWTEEDFNLAYARSKFGANG
jgi:hypothetical protein